MILRGRRRLPGSRSEVARTCDRSFRLWRTVRRSFATGEFAKRRVNRGPGGGERTRTADFYIANVALYQLSYTPRVRREISRVAPIASQRLVRPVDRIRPTNRG